MFVVKASGSATGETRLDHATALVTGAGSGIGRAIALALAAAGARIALVGRTRETVASTATKAAETGTTAVPFVCDVSHRPSVEALAREVADAVGPVDVLVNNAGTLGPIGPLATIGTDEWIETIQTNLVGTFLCCRAFLPSMIERRHGKIINLSGGGATAPRSGFSAYAASKAAVVRLTETLADEVRQYNIQVNAIAPGAVNTRMLDQVLAADGTPEAARRQAELQRESGGTPPERAAALAVFLASPASDVLTGKLVSAVHDRWDTWHGDKLTHLSNSAWFTLRRLDAHTVSALPQSPHRCESP